MRILALRPLGVCVIALALACDSSTTGPGAHGPEFFKATIDREAWVPLVVLAFCGENDLGFNAGRVALPGGTQETMLLRLATPLRLQAFVLGDSSTGRSASFVQTPESGPQLWFNSTSGRPGRAEITGVDFEDSVVAGTFRFDAVSTDDPGDIRRISGSFRTQWTPVFTAEHPDGIPCT